MLTRSGAVTAIIRQQKVMLGLGDWDIRYSDAKTDDDAAAQTNIRPYQKVATIRIDSEVTGDHIDQVVTHELMHLVLHDLKQTLDHTLTKMGDLGLGVLDLVGDHMERICEQVSIGLTGVPWEPVGEDARTTHAPFIDFPLREED